MADRAIARAVALTAAGAAWFAARFAGFLPLLWVLLLLACLGLEPRRRRLVSSWWLAAVVTGLGVSWVVALDHEAAVRLSLLVGAAVLLFGLARYAPPGRTVLTLLAAGIGLASLVALVQVAGGLAAFKPAVEGLAPGMREAAATRLEIGRAFGTASLPGHFAVLMVMVLPLLAERVVGGSRSGRVAWAALSLVTVAGIVATRSVAAAGVGAILLLVAALRRRRRAALAAGAVLVVAAALVVASRGDLRHLEPLRLRAVNWRTAAWAVEHHPLTGVGLGGVGQAGLTAPTAAANTSPFAHCTPLQLVAELGLAGLGLVVAAIAGLAGLLARGLRTDLPLTLAVAAVPLHNLVDFSLYSPEVLLPWAVLAGVLASTCTPQPRRPLSPWVLVPVLAAGVVLATLNWRGEREAVLALQEPAYRQAPALVAASRWQPWALTPLLAATDVALRDGAPSQVLASIDDEIRRRWWVRPVSAAWAEARARLLLAAGRPNQALPWAVEARRRAPWRDDLRALEEACR